VNVDVDWMDPTYSKNLSITPNDQTSNNLWVNQQMDHEENKEMVKQVCKELKSQGWKAAYTRIVGVPNVFLSHRSIADIVDHRQSTCARTTLTTSGAVFCSKYTPTRHTTHRLSSTLPAPTLKSLSASVFHKTAIALRFPVSKRRSFISLLLDLLKFLGTGPALNACQTLKKEGIRTLGTALFGLPQAIACSQAGCLYISPYFNGMLYLDAVNRLA